MNRATPSVHPIRFTSLAECAGQFAAHEATTNDRDRLRFLSDSIQLLEVVCLQQQKIKVLAVLRPKQGEPTNAVTKKSEGIKY